MRKNPLDIDPGQYTVGVRAARIYSNILSPPSIYAIFGLVLAVSELPFWHGFYQAAIFGALTSLFPILYIAYLLKTEKISDLHISDQRQRHIPYLVGIAGAGIAFLVLENLGSPTLLLNFVVTDMLALSLLAILNVFWLVSAHMTGVTIITAFSGFAFGITTSLMLLPLVALTFYIRLFLRRHTIPELIGGALLGVSIVFGLAFFGVFG